MAFLAFGFQLREVHPFTQVNEHGDLELYWKEALCQRMGIVPLPESADYEDPAVQSQHEHYCAAQAALVENLGCSIEQYGYERAPEFFVQLLLPGAEYSMNTVLDLDAMNAVNNPANRARLLHFCGVMGIEYREPNWCLLRFINDD